MRGHKPDAAAVAGGFKKRRWVAVLLAGFLILLGVMIVGSWFAGKPAGLGIHAGRLAKCPDSPNCVCSQDDRDSHHIAAFSYQGDGDAAFSRLIELIEAHPRTRIVTRTDDYLHVEFTTAILRFTDDVEFLLQNEKKQIQVRSASRIGYSDLGKNRKRVEALRAAFEAKAE